MEETLLIKVMIKTLKKYFWIIILFSILGGIGGKFTSTEAPAPTFEASSLFLVEKNAEEKNVVLNQIESDRFFNTAATLINTSAILDKVIQNLDLNIKSTELNNNVKVNIENNSQIINVVVEDSDSKRASDIANEVVSTFQKEIGNYLDVEMVKVIKKAEYGDEKEILHSRPKATMAMGVIIGFVLGTIIAFVLSIFLKRKQG